MTRDERAERWFRDIPHAKEIDLERKMDICRRVAIRMVFVFFAVFIVEWILMLRIGDGKAVAIIADSINTLTSGTNYKMTAIMGGLIVLHVIILPAAVTIILRNVWIKSETLKAIDEGRRL